MNTTPTEPAAALQLDDAPTRSWWRRPLVWAAVALVVLILFTLRACLGGGVAAGPQYVTELATRGTLRLSIHANGTLQSTRSVEVGSELSGTVARVLVDVNDRVRVGQVLVELDTAKLRDDVARARAGVSSAEAAVAEAVATMREQYSLLARLEDVARLSGGKVPSASELDSAVAALARAQAAEVSARALVVEARATLATNETNLGKASIRSPIDGVVLARTVDPGNAVAASLQAVTLFTLAEDLSRLKLEVNVDEADIGQLEMGQQATFTVSAWPNRRYPAQVRRVDFGSTTTDNVVTYTTTLEVANEDLSLRPGMTASAVITATERVSALLVPNTALRFAPVQAAGGEGEKRGLLASLLPSPPPQTVVARTSSGDAREVWVLRDGRAVAVPVSTGLSDGRSTEILAGDLEPGWQVIVDQRSGAQR